MFKKFEEIEAWKLARELAREIYQLTRTADFAKDWGLKDQIQRAAVSIGSNIAEGFGRRGNKEFVKFLWIAKGSAAEVQSQLYTAVDLSLVAKEQFDSLYNKANLIQALIFRLIESLSGEPERRRV